MQGGGFMLKLKEKPSVLDEQLMICNEMFHSFVKRERLRLITNMSPEAVQVLLSMEIIDAYRTKDVFNTFEFNITFLYNGEVGTLETNNLGSTISSWFPFKTDLHLVREFLLSPNSPFSFYDVARIIEKAKKEEKRLSLKEKYVDGNIVDILSKQKDFEEDVYFLVLKDGTKARLLI